MNDNTTKQKKIRWELFRRFLDKDKTPSPLLLLISMFLILSFRIAMSVFPDKTGGYLGILILQLIIFFIPAYLYSKFISKGRIFLKPGHFKLKPPSIDRTFLIISASVLICALMFTLDKLCRWNIGYPDGFYLYNTFFTGKIAEPDNALYPVITFAVVPAICEEFVFRGVIHNSYENKGFSVAAIMSAIMFSLVTLDVALIPSALIFSLMMSFLLYITNSLISCFIVNFIYKMFMLFFGTNMADYMLTGGNNVLLFTIVLLALLLSLTVFGFECSRAFKEAALENRKLPTLCEGGINTLGLKLSQALFTKCIIICACIYVAFNILVIFM